MTRSSFFFKGLWTHLMATLAFALGLLSVTSVAQAQTSTTTVSCVNCVPATPTYGVRTWTDLQSAGIGQAAFKVVGTGKSDGSGAFGITDELFKVTADISYKVDPNCGPKCGEQTAKLGLNSLQQVGSGSIAKMVGANATGNAEGSATATNGSAAMSRFSAGASFSPFPVGITTPTKP